MFGRASGANPDGGIGTNFYFTTANAELRVSAHAASRIWFNDDQINFDNAATGLVDSAITWNNRMFINASGYLGVGATTAIAQLHVDAKDTPYDSTSGLAVFQDNGDRQIVIGGLGLFRRDTNGNADLRINYIGYNGGVTQPRDLDIYDGKNNRFARFQGSTQRLGIGVDAPTQKLQVDGGATGINQGIPATSGTTQNGILRLTSGSATYGETLDMGMNVGPTYAWIQPTNKDNLATNYNLALNPNGGNVGIGSVNPGRGLTIDKSNEFAALEIIKNNSGNQIVYLGTGSSGTGENAILQLKEGTVEKLRMYSTGTSYINGGNLVIGNTTSDYDFEVFGTDAKIFAHYSGNSRGGIAAFSSQRIAMTTTSINDNLVFGYGSSTAASADFVERMRIDNGTGFVGIGGVTSPQALLSVGSGSLADANIPVQISTSGGSTQRWYGVNKNGSYGLLLGYMEGTALAGAGGYVRNITEDPLYFMVSNSDLAMTITSNKNITAEESLQVKEAIRVFGNNVSDISATNSPTTTSVNIGTYINEYSFIDLSSSNTNGSWIDFSNADGTDYRGRIRYNFTSDVFKIYAGAGERVNIGIAQTNVMNTFKNSNATYDLLIGQASFTWGGSTATYPTVYGSHSDRWVMYTFPHITCLQNGVNGHTGTSTGAKIRFAANAAASSFWDAGVDLQYNAADRFSIARAGAIMINCLTPNSTYSGLASRDWTIFGTGSRAGGIAINDIAGANYAIYAGGYDLTFSKSVNGTSLASALTILGDNAADSTPDIQIHNNLTVNGTASVDGTASIGNAATIDSNSSSRVLYLRQQSTNSGNIIQFQDQSSNNTWEVVGRNNIFYLYNNMNSVGYVLNVRADNGYLKIGNSNNASYHLDVEGTIRASSDVIAFSDKRVKENIITINSALDKVTKLRGVTYTRKDTDDKSTKVGVIAQEVLEVLPEIVSKDDEGMYSVAYGNMAGVFIEAIKELKAEVDSLKQEIKELKK
jgi:hypothetical protein